VPSTTPTNRLRATLGRPRRPKVTEVQLATLESTNFTDVRTFLESPEFPGLRGNQR